MRGSLATLAAAALLAPPATAGAVERDPPKDAVTPSSITIVAGKLRDSQFSATGYFEFASKVTGSVYGHWVISNGVYRERVPFTLRRLKKIDYTPWTTNPKKVPMKGKTLTATLVVGKVRSSAFTLLQ